MRKEKDRDSDREYLHKEEASLDMAMASSIM
jgi:hypothetical protein